MQFNTILVDCGGIASDMYGESWHLVMVVWTETETLLSWSENKEDLTA